MREICGLIIIWFFYFLLFIRKMSAKMNQNSYRYNYTDSF